VVRGQPHRHPLHLHPETDVKILRDVAVGPPFCLAIRRVLELDTLQCFPAEEGVVPDKGGDVSGADAVFDGCVDDVCEIRDWTKMGA
jgi:hypothetical protein